MDRQPLNSSSVRSAGYDAATQRLEIEFQGGRVYQYADVPAGVFTWLLRTPNKGAYVTRMIAQRYAYEEITQATAAPPEGSCEGSHLEGSHLEGSLEAALRASLQPPSSD